MSVLPNNNGVVVKIADINNCNISRIWFEDQPSNMSVQQSFVNRIWISVSVGVAMMCAMVSGPRPDGVLDRSAAKSSQPDP